MTPPQDIPEGKNKMVALAVRRSQRLESDVVREADRTISRARSNEAGGRVNFRRDLCPTANGRIAIAHEQCGSLGGECLQSGVRGRARKRREQDRRQDGDNGKNADDLEEREAVLSTTVIPCSSW